MNNLENEELIQLCKEGSEEAFNELYRRFYPIAYRLAYHISNSDADAHDATQETMIAVHNYIGSLRQPEFFSLWLKRIVVAKCNRIFRKNKHIIFTDEESFIMKDAIDTISEHDPKLTIHFKNDKEVIEYFVHMLPKPQADVMEMYYFNQLSIKEIAKKLELPVGTIKTRMYTSKRKLKEFIIEYEKTEDIALDFRSDALLTSLGAGSLLSTILNPSKLFTSSMSIGKVALISIVSVGTITGVGAVIKKQYDDNQKDIVKPLISTQEEKKFTNVSVGTMEIKNPQDAYFKLILWTDNEGQMKEKSKEERLEMKILLDSLKAYGGHYYNLLEKRGWITSFESSM